MRHLDLHADLHGVDDCTTLNTAAFALGVRQLAAAGGGTLVVARSGLRSRGCFLTAPFNLTSNMRLVAGANTTILGSGDMMKWPIVDALPSYGQGRDHPGPRHSSLVGRPHPPVH